MIDEYMKQKLSELFHEVSESTIVPNEIELPHEIQLVNEITDNMLNCKRQKLKINKKYEMHTSMFKHECIDMVKNKMY